MKWYTISGPNGWSCDSGEDFCFKTYGYNSSDIPFGIGWNMVTVSIVTDWWASDLADNVSGCTMVSSWNNSVGTYDSYIVGGPSSFDYHLKDGVGYFVCADETSAIGVVGSFIDTVSVLSLIHI